MDISRKHTQKLENEEKTMGGRAVDMDCSTSRDSVPVRGDRHRRESQCGGSCVHCLRPVHAAGDAGDLIGKRCSEVLWRRSPWDDCCITGPGHRAESREPVRVQGPGTGGASRCTGEITRGGVREGGLLVVAFRDITEELKHGGPQGGAGRYHPARLMTPPVVCDPSPGRKLLLIWTAPCRELRAYAA
jgi:hypothetical protein